MFALLIRVIAVGFALSGQVSCFWEVDQSGAPFQKNIGNNDNNWEKEYSGHCVYRVPISNATVKQLISGELHKRFHYDEKSESLVQSWDSWTDLKTGSNFDVRIPPSDRAFFESLPVEKSILIEDVQKLIDLEQSAMAESALRLERTKDEDGEFFKKYHTLDELYDWMDKLAEKYPMLVRKIEVGTSYEKRPIRGLVLFDQVQGVKEEDRKSIVFHGAQHAREWISTAVVTYIASQLLDKFGADDKITELLQKYEWTIIPVLNVDGYFYTHTKQRMWRKNRQPTKNGFCVGTDPNRNWDYEWDGEGSATFPCSEIYRGEFPFSSPEAKAIATYLKEKKNVVLYIDWHAYSQLWLFPWGFDCSKKPKNFDSIKRAADAAADAAAGAIKATNGLEFTTEAACDLYPVSGASIDYAYGALGIPFTYAVELRDKGRYGFMLPPQYIIPSGEEAYAGLLAIVNFINGNDDDESNILFW